MYGGAVEVVALLGAVAAALHSSSNLEMLVAAPHALPIFNLGMLSFFVFPVFFCPSVLNTRVLMRRCLETMALEQYHQDDKAEVCMTWCVLFLVGASISMYTSERNKHTDGAAKARVGKRVACNRMG